MIINKLKEEEYMRQKVIFSFLIIILILLPFLSLYSQNNWGIKGEEVNDTTYYPLYKIINILHIERRWDFYTGKFILQDGSNYLNFIIGEPILYINRKIKNLDTPPIRINGKIYIPEDMLEYILKWKEEKFAFSFDENKLTINSIKREEKKESIPDNNKNNYPIVENNLNNYQKSSKEVTKISSVNDNKKARSLPGANKISVIVIDPGHGGKDPGAIGQKGLREKDVVLKVGLKVRKILKEKLKNKNIQIVMTRNKDIFIPLKKRAEIANSYVNKNRAGIFISIHANASIRKKSHGIETFVLSPVASDDEARAVAAMENGIIDSGNKKKVDTVSRILSQMLSYEYIRESIELAKFVNNGYRKHLPGKTEIRGIKKALFYVLEGSFMPAILTEIGFVTNRKEEKLLRTDTYQTYIARAIADGIIKFIKWYESNNGFIQ